MHSLSKVRGGAILAAAGFGMALPAAAGQNWIKPVLPPLDWTSVAASSDGTRLVAVANNVLEGSVYISQDSGQTWRQTGAPPRAWTGVASSADGMKLVIVGNDFPEGPVYVSADAGVTWDSAGAPAASYTCAASSADGATLILGANDFPGGALYVSSDSGQTWSTTSAPLSAWTSVAASADGLKLFGVSNSFPDGPVYTSANGGLTWTHSSAIASSWMSVACSADGNTALIASNAFPNGTIYRTTNGGATWPDLGFGGNNWSAVSMSATGTHLVVASALINGQAGGSHLSPDAGATWRPSGLPALAWSSLASSADGRHVVAAARGDGIYLLRPYEPGIAIEHPTGTALADGEARNFGPVSPSRTADMVFTIRNVGGIPLTGFGFTVDGADSGEFSIVANPAASVPFEGTTSFTVRHTPGSAGPKSAVLHLASSATGSQDPFDIVLNAEMTAVDMAFDPATSAEVTALTTQADGKILVGGRFTSIGGGSRKGIVRLNPDGSVDSDFVHPLLFGFSNSVSTIAVQPDGKIVVSGGFDLPGGVDNEGLARLNPDGSLDTGFMPPKPNGGISCLAIQPDGKILIGGDFNQLSGTPRGNVARLNADGSLDVSFTAQLSDTVHAIALQPDGRILVGGAFLSLPAEPGHGLVARFESNGSLDLTFKPFPYIGSIFDSLRSLAVQPDGKIVVGGLFGPIPEVPRANLARFLPDGTLDAAFNPDADGRVNDIILQADGRMLIGGTFTHMGGVPRNRIARLNPDGSVEALNPNVFGGVEALALQADGRILLGGGFEGLDGAARNYLVRLENDPAIGSLQLAGPGTMRWLRGGSAPEISDASFEILTATSPIWTPLGAGHRIAGGWELGGLTLPTSGGVRLRGGTPGGSGSASQTQNLLALGSPPPGLSVEQPAGNPLGSSASPVSFGAVYGAGDSRTLTFKIQNLGSTPIGSLAAAISGPHAGNFTVTAQPAGPVAAFESTQFSVRYSATAPGEDAAMLTLAHDVAVLEPLTIPLAGRLQSDLSPHFATPADVPIARNGFSTAGRTFGTLTLGFAPEPGTVLRAVNNTGPSPIGGRFSDLPDGGVVSATFAGQTYTFVAGYAGGTGNDLVLTVMGRGALDPSFVGPLLQSTPNVIATQADGKILIYTSGLFRLNSDGSFDESFSPQLNGAVTCIAVQPDGKIVIGGYFSAVGGVGRNHLARLNEDGSLDLAFDPNVDEYVMAVAIQSDGRILLGGGFVRVGGVTRPFIARVNPEGTLDPDFNPNANGSVWSLAVQPDGKILIGGRFFTVGQQSAPGLARLNMDGSRDAGFFANFSSGDVLSLAVERDGKILVGGRFTGNLRRLNANGSPSLPFPTASGQVEALALQVDGRILVGGGFTSVGGVPRTGVARINQDGSVDKGFDAALNDGVSAVGVQGNGRMLVGGWFSAVGGVARGTVVRVLNDPATGSLELIGGSTARWMRGGTSPELGEVVFQTRTSAPSPWTLVGTGHRIAGGWELSGISLPSSGALRAVGSCSSGDGSQGLVQEVISVGTPQPGFEVQQPAGVALTSGASEVPFGLVHGANSRAVTFVVENSGNTPLGSPVIAFTGAHSGDFAISKPLPTPVAPFGSAAFEVRFAPQGAGVRTATMTFTLPLPGAAPVLVSLSGERDDTLAPAFGAATSVPVTSTGFTATGMTFGTMTLGFTPAANSVLKVVDNTGLDPIAGRFADLPEGGLVTAVFGGRSHTFIAWYGGGTGNDLILTLFGPGRLDTPFYPRPARDSLFDHAQISSVVVQPDGKIVVGGGLDTISGVPRSGIARLNRDGSLDETFDTSGITGQFVRLANCIVVQSDGKLLVGGVFDGIGGVSRNNLARLQPDGSLDTDFNPNVSGTVLTLAVQPDGKIVLGGYFSAVGGVSRMSVARLDPDGSLDTGFSPSADAAVRCLAVQTDGKVLLGGEFTLIGTTTRNRIARLNANGSLDSAFNPNADGAVNGLTLQADGRLLIGGEFTRVGTTTRNHVARLNTNGSIDAAFNPNADAAVNGFALQADGKVLLGGSFAKLGSATRASIARLNPSGSLDAAFDSILAGSVSCLALQEDGLVLLGGSFGSLAGVNHSTLARLGNGSASSTLESVGGTGARWLRTGSCPEVNQATFEVKAGGAADWVALGEGIRISGGWELTGVALPADGQLRARGRSGGSVVESLAAIGGTFTALEQWRQAHFGSPLNAGEGADLADTDFDTLPNLLEFAHGLDPTRPDTGGLPRFERSGGEMVLSFATPAGISGVTYGAEQSSTLQPGSWISIPDTGTGAQHRFSLPVNGPQQFLRQTVTAP